MNEDFLYSEAFIRCPSPEQVLYYLKEGELDMKHLLTAVQILCLSYKLSLLKKKTKNKTGIFITETSVSLQMQQKLDDRLLQEVQQNTTLT